MRIFTWMSHWSGRRLACAGLALLTLGVLAYLVFWYVGIEGHLKAAEQALARHDYEEARQHLAKYLATWPRDARANFLAAQTARRLRRYADAGEHLRVCRERGWSSIEAPGYGKGYVEADTAWRDLLAGLDWLRRTRGMLVVLVAHSAIETINDPRVPAYTSYQLRVHRRARGLLQDWADAIGFLGTDVVIKSEDTGFGKKRVRADGGLLRYLHFEARPAFTAKNRYALPAKMPVPLDFDFAKLAPFFPSAVQGETVPFKRAAN